MRRVFIGLLSLMVLGFISCTTTNQCGRLCTPIIKKVSSCRLCSTEVVTDDCYKINNCCECNTNNCNCKCDCNNPGCKCLCPKDVASKVKKPCKPFITVTGKGAPPQDENLSEVQRYLLAERAAIVDGYRQLAEKLEGFIVSTLTRAGNYVINKDIVKVEAQAMIRGAEVMEVEHLDNGVALAKIRIRVPTNREIVATYVDMN